jgi:hypothetical protein
MTTEKRVPVKVVMPAWLVEEMDRLGKITRQTRASLIIASCIAEVTRLAGARPHFNLAARVEAPKKDPLSKLEKEWFEEFFAACRKRERQGSAEQAFKKALTIASAKEIIEGARRWTEAKRGIELTYVQLPHSWLNDKGWLSTYKADPSGGGILIDKTEIEKTKQRKRENEEYKQRVIRERLEEGEGKMNTKRRYKEVRYGNGTGGSR